MPAVPPAGLRAPRFWLRLCCSVGQAIALCGLPRVGQAIANALLPQTASSLGSRFFHPLHSLSPPRPSSSRMNGWPARPPARFFGVGGSAVALFQRSHADRRRTPIVCPAPTVSRQGAAKTSGYFFAALRLCVRLAAAQRRPVVLPHFASRQLSPTPTSAISGTSSACAPSISRFTRRPISPASSGGASNTSSS